MRVIPESTAMASAIPAPDARVIAPALSRADRIAIWGGLAALSALAWLYLWRMPAGGNSMASMAGMAGMAAMPGMSMASPWSPAQLWMTFSMWAVMMVAMMMPSAAPMVTLYARIVEGRGSSPRLRVWLFAGGYIAVWTAFSVGAAMMQAALDNAAMLTGAMRVAPLMGGIILALAGIYQISPLKRRCLRHCQSPMGFLMIHWRDSMSGALAMGAWHGVFCVGCCWMLMGLLFVAGVMNLAWVALLTTFVLIERVTPWGQIIAAVSGFALIAGGLAMAALS
jgi:predicted metal-binding membrane protein